MLFSIDDLQIKTAIDQYSGKKEKHYGKYGQSAGHNIYNVISYFMKQISVRSFFPFPPASGSLSESEDITRSLQQWYRVLPAGSLL